MEESNKAFMYRNVPCMLTVLDSSSLIFFISWRFSVTQSTSYKRLPSPHKYLQRTNESTNFFSLKFWLPYVKKIRVAEFSNVPFASVAPKAAETAAKLVKDSFMDVARCIRARISAFMNHVPPESVWSPESGEKQETRQDIKRIFEILQKIWAKVM